jgi:DNA (cytosine-5)-methyltransferase 1
MGADEFVIKTSLNQALFGFGDAVCVPVIEWIARNYLNPVWEEEFAPLIPNQRRPESVTYRKIARK